MVLADVFTRTKFKGKLSKIRIFNVNLRLCYTLMIALAQIHSVQLLVIDHWSKSNSNIAILDSI